MKCSLSRKLSPTDRTNSIVFMADVIKSAVAMHQDYYETQNMHVISNAFSFASFKWLVVIFGHVC